MTCTPTSASNGKRQRTGLWLHPPTRPYLDHHIDDLLAEAARPLQRDPPSLTMEERQRYGLE